MDNEFGGGFTSQGFLLTSTIHLYLTLFVMIISIIYRMKS